MDATDSKRGRILVAGAGAVGCAVLTYLALNGKYELIVCDGDTVEESNLLRQSLYTLEDTGKNKAYAAAARLRQLRPSCSVLVKDEFITNDNIKDIIRDVSYVIECTDDIDIKYLINDHCVDMGIPFTVCGIGGKRGQLMSCLPGESACLRCIFPYVVKTAKTDGFPPVCGIIGTAAASEAISFMCGDGQKMKDRLLFTDLKTAELGTVKISRNTSCRCSI